jgi:iron complex outermembrane receptor protein
MNTAYRQMLFAGASLSFLLNIQAVVAADSATPDQNGTDAPTLLPAVSVEGAVPAEGSAESGYRSSTTTLGPLGNQPMKDTPFSVHVVSSDMIDNLQATSTSDALKYDPTVRAQLGSNFSSNYFMIRGFTSSPFGPTSNATVDNMRETALFEPVEDKERIEVQDGPASFLYGFAAPGGTVNYELKHPTETTLNRVTSGDYGGEQGYLHGDFGGPIDPEGRLAYRVNILKVAAGNVGVDGETHKRELYTGALDWRLTTDTVWSFDASHFDRDIRGQQGIFLADSYSVPKAPDLSKNYGAPWSFTHDQYDRYGTSIISTLNDIFAVRSAFRYSETRNSALGVRDALVGNNGTYDYQLQVKGTNGYNTTQGYSFVDAKFDTFGIDHKVTFGVADDHVIGLTDNPDPNASPYSTAADNLTLSSSMTSNILSPNAPNAYPNINLSQQLSETSRTNLRTIIAADKMTLNNQWSVLGGLNMPRLETISYATNTGVPGAGYIKDQVTPAGAVMFKPIPAVTTYVSYVEALQQGATVGSSYANSGQILAPYLSHQYEVGAKSTVGKMDINVALFQIDKAALYIDPTTNLESTGGQEVHKGVEFTFTGKVTDEVTLGGGFTFMDANLVKDSVSRSVQLSGVTVAGVPHTIATLFGEYAVPELQGVTLLAGSSFTGREGVDTQANGNYPTLSIPAVFLMDAGARFQAEIYGTPTTFRLNVNNLLGTRYWTNKGDDMLYPGNPRTVAFSVTADF